MSFKIKKYSLSTFKDLLIEYSEIDQDFLHYKGHLNYIDAYLTQLEVKTILVEEEYIDKDYIEDFAAYYVRCFSDYVRICTRFHFFSVEINSDDDFSKILETSDFTTIKTLQDSYLGFIVLKPLPQTIIGRTCLKTYDTDGGRRNYSVCREYKANLYGIDFSIKTIAYQEQDSTVSACASTAIWSAFQGTGILFQHQIPSPVEITKSATVHTPFSNRHFPNKGLSMEQMAHAVRNVGLEPFLVNVSEMYAHQICKGTIYAFLKAKIPIIFGFGLHDITSYTDPNDTASAMNYKTDRHAVTINGFSLPPTSAQSKFAIDVDFYLTSLRIDEIYVHDDGVGPYARMKFDTFAMLSGSKSITVNSLSTSWPNRLNSLNNVKAVPFILLTPLNHKIRIPYDMIQAITNELNSYFSPGFRRIIPIIEWDIHLIGINEYKSSVLNDSSLEQNEKLDILTSTLPKYLWRVAGKADLDKIFFELLFDATDIEQGVLVEALVIYDQPTFIALRNCLLLITKGNTLSPTMKKIINLFEAKK